MDEKHLIMHNLIFLVVRQNWLSEITASLWSQFTMQFNTAHCNQHTCFQVNETTASAAQHSTAQLHYQLLSHTETVTIAG